MLAVPEVVRPVWGGSVCVLDVDHDGPHRDRAGDGWWVTPEIADAVSVLLVTRALTALRSPRCTVGRHDHCRDGNPRETGVQEVRHLACDCPCHTP